MKRYMVTTSSDGKREEVDYTMLTGQEIARLIAGYERKYGTPLNRYLDTFSCDRAASDEVFDLIEWETLVEERDERASECAKSKP